MTRSGWAILSIATGAGGATAAGLVALTVAETHGQGAALPLGVVALACALLASAGAAGERLAWPGLVGAAAVLASFAIATLGGLGLENVGGGLAMALAQLLAVAFAQGSFAWMATRETRAPAAA
ncbi:MAG TPA: hypothetical protein VM889_14015 [Candidatus Thermoplasmatota archaeon]|nr:hypothetical protein [Candidatus Thermoplasmatota archaeon]